MCYVLVYCKQVFHAVVLFANLTNKIWQSVKVYGGMTKFYDKYGGWKFLQTFNKTYENYHRQHRASLNVCCEKLMTQVFTLDMHCRHLDILTYSAYPSQSRFKGSLSSWTVGRDKGSQ
jgi:hypothetical protein